ncbi:MAG: L,D-transpeptidase [Phycisphaerales bacterium]|nr:L,D-transpeptidase [Phycisphaerales bacterium]MCB9862489.1 L,D-transpeptidase [Phycisphaerales bacterium]
MMDAPGCRTDVDDLKSANLLIPGTELPSAICERLQKAGWRDRVGDRIGVWVSVEHQKLVGIEGTRIAFVYPCSTAERGTGSRENSYKTPLGWHYIDERIGGGAPEGAVFKSRVYQNEVWKPGDETEKDLVLTRIMWLRGLEEGRNVGPGIDSHDRYIYIHGTPAEDKIGTPASHGCIRLKNRDVIEVFDRTRAGTRVLITKW